MAPSPAPVGPWPFWPSFGWMLAVMAGLFGAQLVAGVIVGVTRVVQGQGKLDVKALETDGLLVSLAMLFATPVVLALSALVAHLRHGPKLGDYFALRGFRALDLGFGVLGLIVMWTVSAVVTPEPSPWMVRTYANRGPEVLFFFALVVLDPLVEEVLFRGLAYPGLATGRFGRWGAIAITTVVWTALHIQYGWRELIFIVSLGVLLGWIRARSGSLPLTMLLHALNNLAAMLALRWQAVESTTQ